MFNIKKTFNKVAQGKFLEKLYYYCIFKIFIY